MTFVLRHPYGRALGAAALSVALVSGGTAGAYAAQGKPTPTTMASITVKADKTKVKAGDTVTFSGRTKGLKIGTKLVLQHQKSGKWTALRATTKVRNGSAYSLPAKFRTKGMEMLRVAAGKVYSPTVMVTVS
ncbi:hypothetical protein [Streptomyces sp. NPDC002671]